MCLRKFQKEYKDISGKSQLKMKEIIGQLGEKEELITKLED